MRIEVSARLVGSGAGLGTEGRIQDYNQNARPRGDLGGMQGLVGSALCISLISDRWLDRLPGEI